MTKLEPTRTSSDLTATDRLRELLDERGVGSYTLEAPAAVCLAFFDGKRWHDCWESVGGEVNVTFSMTPEQAIAATLGSCNCTNDCTNSERTDGADATAARQVDAGTCHVAETERFECLDSRYKSFDYNPYITVHVMECSACGRTYEHVNGAYEFCPHCGRRVVEVDA